MINFNQYSSKKRRLIKRVIIAYSGAVLIVLLAVLVSMVRGAGWKPALAGMPLYLTIFLGIAYQLVKEWRFLKRGRERNEKR
ncbi:hypothetical protein [Pandoraea sp. ISTKB]|uniref:hypothetical protein n=1 Tax=Pandoraea sp. ISTKB TaxID=1586708 RepID=UPI001112F935|nr:hypothetical protein [Pandoraea sp. ISTKB]